MNNRIYAFLVPVVLFAFLFSGLAHSAFLANLSNLILFDIAPVNTPTVATATVATAFTKPSPIAAGQSETDNAILTGGSNPTGSITFYRWSGSACSGSPTIVDTITSVSGDGTYGPSSPPVGYSNAGSYSWNAVYSGDNNNNAATSPCEPLTVKATPTVVTAFTTNPTTAGQSDTDTATVSGGDSPTGTVTFYIYLDASCSGTPGEAGSPALSSGTATSNPQTFVAGTYSWNAVYNGDVNNYAATSPCETLTVNPATPTVATALAYNPITAGQSDTDTATLSGGYVPSGTVTFYTFTGNTCSGTATAISPSNSVTGNGAYISASSGIYITPGPYSWNAVYSGDVNNYGAISSCEPLTVNKTPCTTEVICSPSSVTIGGATSTCTAYAHTTIQAGNGELITWSYATPGDGTVSFSSSTCALLSEQCSVTVTGLTHGTYGFTTINAVYPGDTNNLACSGTAPLTINKATPTVATAFTTTSPITAGQSDSDTATVSGGSSPTGTVTFYSYSDSSCTQNQAELGFPVILSGTATSLNPTFSADTYYWNAVYNGDANNNAATSPCETLTVNPATPTVATTLTANPITAGQYDTDKATVSGGYVPSGTVTFYLYSGASCSGTHAAAGSPALVSGTATSSSVGPFVAGAFSWNAVYNGDSNNNQATSSCETLMVNNNQPKLIVIKIVNNNYGGTATSSSFGMNVIGTNAVPSSFAGSASGTTVTLNAGTYSVTETGLSGYTQVSAVGCSGTISAGDTVTCTYTNNDIQPKLTVYKVVNNNYGGTLVPGNFPLFVSSMPVTTGVQTGFNTNTYTITETQQTGYTGGTVTGDCAANGAITLHVGDIKSCTITNNDIQPQLTVIKTVNNNYGGTAVPSNFGMNVTGTGVVNPSFAGSSTGVMTGLNAGSYSVSETSLSGYSNVYASAGCSGTIAIGENAVCTLTNNDIPATSTTTSSTTTTFSTTISTTSSTSTSSSTTMTTTATTTTTIPYCKVNYGLRGWFSYHFGWFVPYPRQNCISTTSTSTSTVTTTILPVDTGLGNPTVSPTSPATSSGFTISCPAKNQDFNCINAYANGLQKECKWIKWSGNDAIFECKGMPAGIYTAECAAIPDTTDHCAAASTTLSYSVIAPSTTTTTTRSTTIPTTKSTTVRTTTINPCHYWDGQDYDGCSPLTTTIKPH